MSNEQNIEDWFNSVNKGEFPNGEDYISKYSTIRDYMNSQIHGEIKSIVAQLVPEVYLNDHGERHIKKVIEKASEILGGNFDILSPYEVFFLLLSIQIHDAGHIINGRSNHAKNAKEIISKFGKESLSSVEKRFIAQIAKAHSGKDDPIGQLNEEQVVSNKKVNLRLIAAIVRLADELADDTTRASSFLLDNDLLTDNSRIFHQYSQCLDSCIADSNQIRMCFYLDEIHLKEPYNLGDAEIYLLDEIYNRALKTFTESIYCNRFLPEKLRIRSINVDITLESGIDEVEPRRISFRLEEKGYPTVASDNIFEICTSLTIGGKKLTGAYYSDILKKSEISK